MFDRIRFWFKRLPPLQGEAPYRGRSIRSYNIWKDTVQVNWEETNNWSTFNRREAEMLWTFWLDKGWYHVRGVA